MEFDSAENAETAICRFCLFAGVHVLIQDTAKFTGYMYGGRPLGLTFVKYTNVNGGEAMDGQEPAGGMTQEQMM